MKRTPAAAWGGEIGTRSGEIALKNPKVVEGSAVTPGPGRRTPVSDAERAAGLLLLYRL